MLVDTTEVYNDLEFVIVCVLELLRSRGRTS